jgi:hypothetical protein
MWFVGSQCTDPVAQVAVITVAAAKQDAVAAAAAQLLDEMGLGQVDCLRVVGGPRALLASAVETEHVHQALEKILFEWFEVWQVPSGPLQVPVCHAISVSPYGPEIQMVE